MQEENSSSYPSSYAHILNVGTGKALKIRDLAQMMIKIFDLDSEPVFTESIIAQVIGYQQIHFLERAVGTLKRVMLVISCIRATHLTSEETLTPLTIFQAMKIGLFLI